MTPEEFDHFLSWLSPDRERAGQKYEEIRNKLIRFFTLWGCCDPEALTDETIDRFVPWMERKNWEWSGEPMQLLYGFAKNIRHEDARKPRPEPISPDIPGKPSRSTDKEHDFFCLDACVAGLAAQERTLISSYYEYAGAEKIKKHQALAKAMGIGMNALRIQAWKIRSKLRHCLEDCIEKKAVN